MTIDINNLINLRGHREQFHSFFVNNFKGGMKNIHRKGAMIYIPSFYAIEGNEIQNELLYEKIRIGEESPMLKICDLIENTVFN